MSSIPDVLGSPVKLPSGRIVPNRFVKASMYEALADWWGGLPNRDHEGLYELWGKGGWGIVITGNAQVAPDHLTLGRDTIIPNDFSEDSCQSYKRLADAIHGPEKATEPQNRPIALLQLSHASRQSPQLVGGRLTVPPVGVSDVPLSTPDQWAGRFLFWFLFRPPTPASDEELERIMDRFVFAAQLAHRCNFDGVQFHNAHGYLLASMLSPKTNTRAPPYGPASITFLKRLVQRVRDVLPPDFVIAIKLNAADYVQGGMTEEAALGHIKDIATWAQEGYGVDLIEISGGNYENLRFMENSIREAFFSTFSRSALSAVRGVPKAPKIILTGSIRSVNVMMETITSGHADFVAVARPSVPYPNLPDIILDPESYDDETFPLDKVTGFPGIADVPTPWWNFKIPLLGAGISTAWWVAFMARQSASQQERGRPLSGQEVVKLERTLGAFQVTLELLVGMRRLKRINFFLTIGLIVLGFQVARAVYGN